jgi:hypothetical protein
MKKRFLINQKGVYYLTTGKLLEYNPNAVKGDEGKEKGVKDVEETFERIKNEPHTWYQAVEVKDSEYGPLNTGQSD